MKIIDISKYMMVGYTFITSPIAGIGFLGYVLYTDNKLKNLENQIRASIIEKEGKSILTKGLEDVDIKGTVTNFDIHEECIIENYQNRFFRIMQPSGHYLPKLFLSMEDAKKEIDAIAPFLKKPVRSRSRIYNIRYVR